jgi:DNA gyrase subunit A
MKTREEDFVAQLIVESTHAYLLCFTNTGRVFWIKVYEIPDVSAAGKGKAIATLLALQPGEKIVTYLGIRDLEDKEKFIFFATRNGTVKRTPLTDFSHVMARGIIAIGVEKDDELIAARITDGKQIIFLATHDGLAIRFKEGDVRSMGRPAYGVRGVDLRKDDYVVGTAVTPSTEARNALRLERAAAAGLTKDAQKAIVAAEKIEATEAKTEADETKALETLEKLEQLDEKLGLTPCLILTVTENGFGKRTDVDAYRLQSRGGKGVINLKATPKVGKVTNIQLVDETSELMIISQFGKIIRMDTKTIRAAGRSTQGVKLLALDSDDKVAAAVVIPPEEKATQPENGTLLQ